MKAALELVLWEVYRKNRVVFFASGILLALGAVLSFVISRAHPHSGYEDAVRSLLLMVFLVSILIGFTPFLLMESTGGWKMNSMLTRWFALPLPTVLLAFAPLFAGCAFILVLVGAWTLVLDLSTPGLDGVYLGAVLSAALILFNAIAWTVPRKPLQFWISLAVLFPVVLILSFGPQDSPNTDQFRRGMLIPLSYVVILLLAYTAFAARQVRCGAWSGELGLPRFAVPRWQVRQGTRARPFRSSWTALASLGLAPSLKILVLSWGALLAAAYVYLSIIVRESHPDLAWDWRVLAMVGVGILPILAIPWLTIWGLFAAGEPSAAFRTRISGFRAALPVTSGAFAADRIVMLACGWAFVWAPLVVLSYYYTPAVLGIETDTLEVIQRFIGRAMAISAFLLVGALPFYLWGRFEGFPNVLLAGVCAWGLAWLTVASLSLDLNEEPGWRWGLLWALLFLKAGFAAAGFALALRQGHCTWKFPFFTVAGWVAAGAFLVWVLPIWKTGGVWAALSTIQLLPLARLAWCPLAIAANRHR